MTQAMLLNWAVGRAQAAARAADSGVGSPRSPPPVSHSARSGAGRDARGHAGIRRTKYRRVPAIFSGGLDRARARATHEGAPRLCPQSGLRSRHLVLDSTLSGARRPGAEGRGTEGRRGGVQGALPGARALSRPSAVIPLPPHLPARARQASRPGPATRLARAAETCEGAELPAATTS